MACKHKRSEVTDTRKRDDYIMRRRKCLICGNSFSSMEINIDVGSGSSAIDALQRKMVREWVDAQIPIR